MRRSVILVGMVIASCLTITAVPSMVIDAAASTGSPPTVVTGPSSAVTITSVTLSGDVDSNGSSTNWYFAYGTTTGYGAKTALQGAGGGTTSIGVSAAVTGLTPGTTYHFRLVAFNGVGTAYGADATFRTLAKPPVVTVLTRSVGTAGATLAGTVDANGLATVWFVRYGVSLNYTNVSATQAIGAGTAAVRVSLFVGGLTPGTTYHYELVARNAVGSTYTPDERFTTRGPPRATTGAAASVGALGATVTGQVNPEGLSTSCYFQYGVSNAYGSRTPTVQAGSSSSVIAVSAVLTGLSPGTVYHFRVVAVGPGGTAYGADGSFTTPGPTLRASSVAVTYGRTVTLTGSIPTGAPYGMVTVFGSATPGASFVPLATVLTRSGGSWRIAAKPSHTTLYRVAWDAANSRSVLVRVRPAVYFKVLSGGRIESFVREAGSLRGRFLRLQRLVSGSWRTVEAKTIGARPMVVFRPVLPRGRSELRVLLTAFQAGPGYLTGLSAVHTVTRR